MEAIYAKLREIEKLASAHGNWSTKAARAQYSKWILHAVDDARFELDKLAAAQPPPSPTQPPPSSGRAAERAQELRDEVEEIAAEEAAEEAVMQRFVQ